MAAESRRSARVERRVPITYTILGTGRTGRAFTQNLNIGGIRFLLPFPIEVDAEMEIVIEFPERAKPMKISGRIVWRRWRSSPETSGPGNGSEVGVKFIRLSEEDQRTNPTMDFCAT